MTIKSKVYGFSLQNISFQCTTLNAKELLKVTVKARGLCYNKSSPGKTTEPIDIKQIEDE